AARKPQVKHYETQQSRYAPATNHLNLASKHLPYPQTVQQWAHPTTKDARYTKQCEPSINDGSVQLRACSHLRQSSYLTRLFCGCVLLIAPPLVLPITRHHWLQGRPTASYNERFLKTPANAEINKRNDGTALIPVLVLNLCCHSKFSHRRALFALTLVTRSFSPNHSVLGSPFAARRVRKSSTAEAPRHHRTLRTVLSPLGFGHPLAMHLLRALQ